MCSLCMAQEVLRLRRFRNWGDRGVAGDFCGHSFSLFSGAQLISGEFLIGDLAKLGGVVILELKSIF